MPARQVIRRHALRIEQNKRHPLYVFSLTGEQLLEIADVARIARDSSDNLIGYQRQEVTRHIRNIANYLNGDEVLFPNSIILALCANTRFKPAESKHAGDVNTVPGILEIPVTVSGKTKPAWIVDGQQRVLALSRAQRKNIPVAISAFVTDSIEVQREQFLRVNSTRPLPRGLIAELIPELSTPLPPHLESRRVPSALCEMLNRDPESPFRGLIHRISRPGPVRGKIVSDTALIRILHESLNSPSGCLFPYRNLATNFVDMPSLRALLLTYWNGVRHTFPDAWGLSPRQSRLMHSAGLRAMGRLMDRIMASIDPKQHNASAAVRQELARIKPICHWTRGTWEGMGLRWYEIQNVPSHVRLLSNAIVGAYLSAQKVAA